jgi:hypothetical protein
VLTTFCSSLAAFCVGGFRVGGDSVGGFRAAVFRMVFGGRIVLAAGGVSRRSRWGWGAVFATVVRARGARGTDGAQVMTSSRVIHEALADHDEDRHRVCSRMY